MSILSCRLLAALVLLAGAVVLAAVPGSARAAQSYDNCTGFIDSLPATISTQGVWCLNKNLGTAITSGKAIEIATNNVTIDCNGFKIGGLAAGDASDAIGIYASSRQNAIVRHCNVRGFFVGIRLSGGAGHLVEDNRLDNNLHTGIYVYGDNNLVQRNRVYDTGGYPGFSSAYGISASADVIDNTVAGVFATEAPTRPYGITIRDLGNVARNNRVRGLQSSGTGTALGIHTYSSGTTIDGNQIVVPAGTPGWGIRGAGTNASVCSNNVIAGFSTAIYWCLDNGGNASL